MNSEIRDTILEVLGSMSDFGETIQVESDEEGADDGMKEVFAINKNEFADAVVQKFDGQVWKYEIMAVLR